MLTINSINLIFVFISPVKQQSPKRVFNTCESFMLGQCCLSYDNFLYTIFCFDSLTCLNGTNLATIFQLAKKYLIYLKNLTYVRKNKIFYYFFVHVVLMCTFVK